MDFYKFNYCPLRFVHPVGGYGPGNLCPECGYGEPMFVPDDVNYNVPPYGSLPSDIKDISFEGLFHADIRYFRGQENHPSNAMLREWGPLDGGSL